MKKITLSFFAAFATSVAFGQFNQDVTVQLGTVNNALVDQVGIANSNEILQVGFMTK